MCLKEGTELPASCLQLVTAGVPPTEHSAAEHVALHTARAVFILLCSQEEEEDFYNEQLLVAASCAVSHATSDTGIAAVQVCYNAVQRAANVMVEYGAVAGFLRSFFCNTAVIDKLDHGGCYPGYLRDRFTSRAQMT